jgi:hypothetical protein|tara:strand:+ start:456 stop:566 length:111 start_codon:yes stop_codon:yes gene_type:complete
VTKQSVFSQWKENSEDKEKKCKKRQKISGEKKQKVL